MTIKALLYSADARDQIPDLASIRVAELNERQILWLDLISPTAEERRQVARLLGVEDGLLELIEGRGSRPALTNHETCFRISAKAVSPRHSDVRLGQEDIALISGRNYAVTVHKAGVDFLEKLRAREKGDSTIGALASESFVASLLDWLLNTYFHALELLVRDIDRVEVAVLGKDKPHEHLSALVAARQRIADLRRMLKSHRDVFYGLARPDFTATARPEVVADFEALSRHYDRAEDDLEHARDLVIGSFELLSTRAAQTTNETMRALTFVTVLMGSLAFVAGIMGMNFQLKFFETGLFGFLVVSGGMLVFAALSVWVARKRRWI